MAEEEIDMDYLELKIREARWFGFSGEAFLDEINGEMIDLVEDALENIEEKILAEASLSKGISQQSLEIPKYNMLCHMAKDFNDSFDRLKGYFLDNVFSVPENIVFPSDKELPETSLLPGAELDVELENLKQQIKQSRAVCSLLKAEQQDIDVVQAKMDELLLEWESEERMQLESSLIQSSKDAAQLKALIFDSFGRDDADCRI